nr:hypothetical protein [Streptomyces sp. DSM 41633]
MTTVEKPDVEEPDVDDSADTGSEKAEIADSPGGSKPQRRLSVSVRSLALGLVIAALSGGVAVLGWLYIGAQHKLDAQDHRSQDYARAENVALDYAVNAAQIKSQDLNPWREKLVAGTSPELTAKLTKAGQEME